MIKRKGCKYYFPIFPHLVFHNYINMFTTNEEPSNLQVKNTITYIFTLIFYRRGIFEIQSIILIDQKKI